jgi:hypothetical protein
VAREQNWLEFGRVKTRGVTMRRPFDRLTVHLNRRRAIGVGASLLLVGAALVIPLESAAAAAPSPPPSPVAPPTHRPLAMGSFPTSSYAAQAAKLPSALGTALQRDVHLTPTQYLADAAAAAQAVKVVASLKSVGVDVLGSKINGTQLTVNVASAADTATVESVGATAVVGAPKVTDYSDVNFQKVTSTNAYGGEAYFYQQQGQTDGAGFRCSIGFNGYSVSSGAAELATAGHCETTINGSAYFLAQSSPTPPGGDSGALGDALGTPLVGTYGSNEDYGLITTNTASFVPQAGLATWGYSTTGAPLASAPLPITGQTAGIKGAPLCKSGSTTGWTCGTIQQVDQSACEGSTQTGCIGGDVLNAIVATTCLLPGDSGGGAVVGTNAVGIDSGGTFGTSCSTPGAMSVFYPIVSVNSNDSLQGQQGSNWHLLTAPVVTSPVSGGTVSASASMSGTLFNAVSSSTVSLFLDGSSTAFATVSASSGSWSIPLTGVSQGSHTYSVSASSYGWPSTVLVTDKFIEAVTSIATVQSPVNGAKAYPSTVMTGTISSPLPASTALLYLNGSTTPYATVNASSGSWSIPLTNLALGNYTYSLAAGIGSTPGTPVTGSFVESAIPPTAYAIDSITGGVGAVSVGGYAIWPDQPSASVTLAVNIGDNWAGITANTTSIEGGNAVSGAGNNHGFSATFPLSPGSYSVCIWTNNSAGGAATELGCQAVIVTTAPPPPPTQSHIDSITGGVGSVTFSGWAVWPDKLSSAVTLAANIGNNWTGFTANQSTSDSGLPANAGALHGFNTTLSLAPGSYSVCLWANNSAGTAATDIGCQSVTVLSAPPTQSHIDSITGGVGSVTFSGWAVWPDKPLSSVNIAINIGNNWTPFTANQSTSDSGLPGGSGPLHGFSGLISSLPAAPTTVCVWAGTSGGSATNLGCQTVTVH